MHLRSLSLLLASALPAQTITLAEGSSSSLTISTLPEANPTAAGTVVMTGVELLPIEISGRTQGQGSDPGVSRLVNRNGLVRVELPGGGRLLRYRRGGGAFWGFLHVNAAGSPRAVLELPGVGAALTDPFADRIGIAADGLHAAVPMAGGGLWLVRLDGGVYASTNAPARLAVPAVQDVGPTSVLVGPQVVWFEGANDTVWRCGLGDLAVPVDVSAPVQPGAHVKGDPVMSGDGSRLVFLYGTHNAWRFWAADLGNGASVLPPPAGKYEVPGYLPEGPGEPALLLNGDGTRLFFIDSTSRDELWLLDVNGVQTALQITEDQIFQPYIGSHILPRFVGPKLLVAIGDPAAMDWFQVQLAPGGGAVGNLTATGSATAPFPAGTLSPQKAAPLGGSLLVTEQIAGGLVLRALDPVTGGNAIVQQGLAAPAVVGDAIGGAADVLVPTVAGDRLFLGTGGLLATAPPGFALSPPTAGPLYTAVGVQLPLPQPFAVPAFFFAGGGLVLGAIEPGNPTLSLTPLGGTLSVGATVWYAAPGTYAVLNRPAAAVRLCLSGAGV